MRFIAIAAAAALIGGCSDGAAPTDAPEAESAKAAELAPGQYQSTIKVTQIDSVDGETPATQLKVDETTQASGCVGPAGKLDPALFGESGDQCEITSSYIRNGRLSAQYTCKRPGEGEVMSTVSGTFDKDGFEGEVSSSSYLSGTGDFKMTRTITAKRAGECTPAAAAEGPAEQG